MRTPLVVARGDTTMFYTVVQDGDHPRVYWDSKEAHAECRARTAEDNSHCWRVCGLQEWLDGEDRHHKDILQVERDLSTPVISVAISGTIVDDDGDSVADLEAMILNRNMTCIGYVGRDDDGVRVYAHAMEETDDETPVMYRNQRDGCAIVPLSVR